MTACRHPTGLEELAREGQEVGLSATITVLCCLAAVAALYSRVLREDFVVVAALSALSLLQVLTTADALEGFANPGVITSAIMYIVSEGICASGVVDFIVRRTLETSSRLARRRDALSLACLMTMMAGLSSLVNSTSVVAGAIPVVMQWSQNSRVSPSQVMVPMSFAAVMGSVITVLGSSSNLILASSWERDVESCRRPTSDDIPPAVLFVELFKIAIPAATMTGAVLILVAPRILPQIAYYYKRIARNARAMSRAESGEGRRGSAKSANGDDEVRATESMSTNDNHVPPGEEMLMIDEEKDDESRGGDVETMSDHFGSSHYSSRENSNSSRAHGDGSDTTTPGFIVHALVPATSAVAGLTVSRAGLRGLDSLFLTSVQRGETLFQAVGPDFVIRAADILSFSGEVSNNFVELCARLGMAPITADNEGEAQAMTMMGPASSASVLNLSPLPTLVNPVTAFVLQAVVRPSPGGTLAGRTPKEADFRNRYDAAILAVYRSGERLNEPRLGQLALRAGDVLVLLTNERFSWERAGKDLKPHYNESQLRMVQDIDDGRGGGVVETVHESGGLKSARGEGSANSREFFIPMRASRALHGKTLQETGMRRLEHAYLVAVQREDSTVRAPGPEFVLSRGDLLWFSGEREGIVALRALPGLEDPEAAKRPRIIGARDRRLVEAVVSLRSGLAEKTVRESAFRTRFDAAIVAIHREGRRIPGKLGDVTLEAGDLLVLEAGPDFLTKHRDDADFLLMSEVEGSGGAGGGRAHDEAIFRAGLGATLILLAVALAGAPSAHRMMAVTLAAGAFVSMEVVPGERAGRAVNWSAVVASACALGMAAALTRTRAGAWLGWMAYCLTQRLGASSSSFATLLPLLILVLNSLGTHLTGDGAISTALLYPIVASLALSSTRHDDARPLLLALGVSSLDFSRRHLANLMVYSPGAYQPEEFRRIALIAGGCNLVSQAWCLLTFEEWWLVNTASATSALAVAVLFASRFPPRREMKKKLVGHA